MSKSFLTGRFKVLMASVCIALLGSSFVSAKPKNLESVKEEDGYYYGYGRSSDKAEALFEGKRDLIENALTATLKAKNPRAAHINVSDDAVKGRLEKVKPFQQTKDGSFVAYRIKIEDWDKQEKAFGEKIRQQLTGRYNSLGSKKNMTEKLNEAVEILTVLSENGVSELLTLQADGTELFSRKVEAVCSESVKDLNLSIAVKDGFVASGDKITVKAVDSNGKAVSGLKLKASWEVASLLPAEKEIAEVVSTAKTDSLGEIAVDFPLDADYKNIPVTLTVSTAFSADAKNSSAMKKLDKKNSVDGNFVCCDDLNELYPSVTVAAGEFTAGAVPGDNRASKREVTHTVNLAAFAIDVAPVTNAQYAIYLHLTRTETLPEYFENADYNGKDYPVVGITAENAENYAAWLSEQTGAGYRLPSEEEFEKAARAGKDSIYPWGDEAPNKAKCANYKKNGKFKFTSPVGAFENGKNDLGLADMAGNVWQLTSSTRSKDEAVVTRTVKGGSWMEGPVDLRISNYKDIDPSNVYPDVGFRLVKDVKEEN